MGSDRARMQGLSWPESSSEGDRSLLGPVRSGRLATLAGDTTATGGVGDVRSRTVRSDASFGPVRSVRSLLRWRELLGILLQVWEEVLVLSCACVFFFSLSAGAAAVCCCPHYLIPSRPRSLE